MDPTRYKQRLTAAATAQHGALTVAMETLVAAATAEVAYADVVAVAAGTERRKTKRAWLFQQRALALVRAADCCRRLQLEPGERHGPTLLEHETHGPVQE